MDETIKHFYYELVPTHNGVSRYLLAKVEAIVNYYIDELLRATATRSVIGNFEKKYQHIQMVVPEPSTLPLSKIVSDGMTATKSAVLQLLGTFLLVRFLMKTNI
ncbi:MAG: hypothetical protein ABIN91_08940 [Mucilaginibacter sp.]|uniref:hypothetical protein n=1 Tax=Mucilaginibacter sp. TaxID=1882438 RepID=UPI003267A4D0